MKNTLVIVAVAVVLIGGVLLIQRTGAPGAGVEPVPAASLEHGIGLFEQKQYPEALDEFLSLTVSGSEDWRAWYYLGSTQMMLKDYAAAAGALEQSLALRPEEPGTLYALGVAYYKQGNLKLAKAYFGAVLEINPNDQHAKGLMDIMNKLEQNSASAATESETGPAENGENGS